MVSFATLTTDVWDVMYNHLQTGTYAISTNNIFSAYNDRLIADKGLPLVVVFPPLISIRDITMTGAIRRANISYQIEAYEQSAKDVKVLIDNIIDKISSGRKVFSAAKLKPRRDTDWFSTIDYDSWMPSEGQRIHYYKIEVNFGFVD